MIKIDQYNKKITLKSKYLCPYNSLQEKYKAYVRKWQF